MTEGLELRRDLYRGTAPFYDRYRPPYPSTLMDDLGRRLPAGDEGRLLDLACGTGQITFPLADRFVEVVAVDQEEESVAFAIAKAEAHDINNITWVTSPVESVDLEGPFELITIGNAFSRVHREKVASRALSWLQPGGGVALLWGGIPWDGDHPWQKVILEFFVDWVARANVSDRFPAEWSDALTRDPHEQVLRRAGFEFVGHFEFSETQVWTIETLTGFMYSTSLLNREALGEDVPSFERDLTERFLAFDPTGSIEIAISYSYDLAVKP